MRRRAQVGDDRAVAARSRCPGRRSSRSEAPSRRARAWSARASCTASAVRRERRGWARARSGSCSEWSVPGGAGLVHERDALRDEALDAGAARGGGEDPRALAAQAVVELEVALDLARVDALRQRRQLVDRPRPGAPAATAVRHGARVERVGDRRLGARRARPARRARRCGTSPSPRGPPPSSSGHEPAADHAGRAGEEDPHGRPRAGARRGLAV